MTTIAEPIHPPMAGRPARERMSPKARARLTGVFYLLNILTIFASILAFRGLIVPGDALATAASILQHLPRFRLGFATEVISTACSIAMAALLYGILRPVDIGFALLATLFRLVACAIAAIGYVFQLAPFVVGSRHYASLTQAQLQDVASVFAALQGHARNVSIAFFACQFIVVGYLIVRSTFLPRWLGGLVALAGVVALMFLGSPVPAGTLVYFVPIGLVAELSLALWLTIVGVDAQRWNASFDNAAMY